MNITDKQRVKKRLDRLAWYLDNSIPLPGLNFRVGIDPLVGLIPGIGDTIGAIMSSYILSEAASLGAPKSILLKMAFNIAVDALAGALPIFGDLFDFGWKANQRNARILEGYIDNPRETVDSSRLFAWVLVGSLIGLFIFVGLLGYLLVYALWNIQYL
ncbi:MAG: DUF4112 domain-containing protein [Bacteroidales bacterium]